MAASNDLHDDPTGRRYYTPAEIQAIFRLSRTTVYELLEVGAIPAQQFGKGKRIPALWVRMMLARGEELVRSCFEPSDPRNS